MSTAKRVFAKLSAQQPIKVQFALVDDVKKMTDSLYQKRTEGRKVAEDIKSISQELNKLLQKADSSVKEYDALLSKSMSLQNSMTAALKELGLSTVDSKEIINLGIAGADLNETKRDLQDDIKFYSR